MSSTPVKSSVYVNGVSNRRGVWRDNYDVVVVYQQEYRFCVASVSSPLSICSLRCPDWFFRFDVRATSHDRWDGYRSFGCSRPECDCHIDQYGNGRDPRHSYE